MGIAGLSIAWRQASHEFGVSPLMSEAAGILALIVFLVLSAGYLVKAVKHPDAVVGEYRHPVAGNFFGMITIAILMLSSVVAQLSQTLAEVIEPRVEELYSLIQPVLRDSGYEELLSSGVVLTGGSAVMQGKIGRAHV